MSVILSSLVDQGVIEQVLRPLKSGKEAQVYLVVAGGEVRVAKVYKDAQHRSFKQRATYTEGRQVRNSRDRRAMGKHSRHGKAQEEAAWKSAEVDMIYRLHSHGVRVPTPYHFIDGVLIMELVTGPDGQPAPSLGELALDADTAMNYFEQLLRQVVRMLCAGVVHGDLSDYNILVDAHGPVIIDFPQAVEAARNRNARQLLVRDVDNLTAFLRRNVPSARRRPFGQEIWAAFENNSLSPEMALTGSFRRSAKKTDLTSLLEDVQDAERDESRRRERSGQAPVRARRQEIIVTPAPTQTRRRRGPRQGSARGRGQTSGRHAQDGQRQAQDGQRQAQDRPPRRRRGGGPQPAPGQRATPSGDAPPKRRRRRRRGGGSAGRPENAPMQQSRNAPAQQPSAPTDTAAAPKKRRRRRRRRGTGVADGPKSSGARD